jgi:hypothetical protein
MGLTRKLNAYTIDTWLGRSVKDLKFLPKMQKEVDNRTK